MNRSRERDAVGHDVGTICFDGFDMGCLYFGTPATVDELKSGNRASAIIRIKHNFSEDPITNKAIADRTYSFPLLVKDERRYCFTETAFDDL